MVFGVFYHRKVGYEISNSDVRELALGLDLLDPRSDGNVPGSPRVCFNRQDAIYKSQRWKRILNMFTDDDLVATGNVLVTNGDVSITYSDLNSVGVLSLTLDPNHPSPKCGDVVKLYSGAPEKDSASETDAIKAPVLFRGTVVRVERSLDKYSITVEDTLGMLRAKSTFAVGRQTAITAIGHMMDSAGVMWYIDPKTYARVANEKYSELYSNISYLDGIKDMIDKVLIQNGIHLILRDNAGIIEITNVENLKRKNLLKRFWMEDYTHVSSIEDGTYNRVMISTSDNGINETHGRMKDILTNVIWTVKVDYKSILTYGRIMTYTGSQQITRMADDLANLIMKYRYYPSQTLDLRGVPGIE
jgi:hypothetical protein